MTTDEQTDSKWQRLPWSMFGEIERLPPVGDVMELHDAGVSIGMYIVTGHEGHTEQVVLKRRKD